MMPCLSCISTRHRRGQAGLYPASKADLEGMNAAFCSVIPMISCIFANIVATLFAMYYCLNRKFKESPLILQGKSTNLSQWKKLWIWFLYFWRFIIIAFAMGFILGALLPLCFQYAGIDPIKALKYSKYLGNIAILPASYLTFISLVCRKEKRQTLRIAVFE